MIVELDKISKYYQNPGTLVKQEVLNELSLNVNKGDSIAIIGPSGSGKSTLLNIIGTLDIPNSGIVKLNGNEINKFDENQLAKIRNKHIGFVFQMHHLLPQLSLIENVLVPVIPQKDKSIKKAAYDRAINLLDSVGLANDIHKRPGQLSGGESQRATVVRALINEPELILADEPTGSLDKESAEQMGELLSVINKKHQVAMIVVTHSQELANKMDVVYELLDGKLVKT
ncbi:MAG: ABC transporter ATP-binding protein [Bacteroidota bacterium]